MILERLACRGFRNLEETDLELSPGTTVLLGANGQGKTSFLEAIGVLATTRSFRRARAPELVRHGESSFAIRGRVRAPAGSTLELSVAHEEGRRSTRIGRLAVDLSEYLGQLTVVAIAQAHAGIVRGSPQDRRDFLDRGILGLRPTYLRSLAAHRRALRHKNALLRRGARGAAELSAWNERLASDAAELVLARRQYVAALREVLQDLQGLFLPASEALDIQLADVLPKEAGEPGGEALEKGRIAELLLERMEELAPREIAGGQALVGPHRDDLVLRSAGRDLRRFASSGQQRNALLALKMAKVELFSRKRGEAPVLLVDDLDTEIDPRRLRTFLQHAGGRAQTVLSSSKPELFDELPEGALVLKVEHGLLRPA